MRKLVYSAAFIFLMVSTTAASAGSRPKGISYEEASAFERAMVAAAGTAPGMPQPLYIQPSNKSEPCKLPTTAGQLARPHIRAFWDGDCKNGFAFGLGRDIAISDTHHIEEIIVHDGTGEDWSAPHVDYDFLNNVHTYFVGGARYPVSTSFSEQMSQTLSGFGVLQSYMIANENGELLIAQGSPFSPQRIYINTSVNGGAAFKFTDNSALPVTNPNAAVFAAQILDAKTKVAGGVAVARYPNGLVRHFRVTNVGFESVTLPAAYTQHLQAKYTEVVRAVSTADTTLQPAQQIEREYLFKACSHKSTVAGLDDETYNKICTWRDQFKEPYAAASAEYQRQLERLRQQAQTVEQQQQVARQLALQQRLAQQQQTQQKWNNLAQGNDQLQQATQQTMQAISNWQPPQVQPINSPSSTIVTCQTVSIMTTCR